MNWQKAALSIGMFALAVVAWADQAYVHLATYPSISVADARSTITVTAEVRDSNGRFVPDGTQVIFESTLGSFRESSVRTTSGTARGVLVAGAIPGTAIITAKCLGFNAVSTQEFEFVSDRSLLSSAKEYIEVVAASSLKFSFDQHVIGAAGPGHGVHVRYRDVNIDADDVQVNIETYELRARHALVKIGKNSRTFDELYLKLNKRSGYGTTAYTGTRIKEDDPFRTFDRFLRANTEPADLYGLVAVLPAGVSPATDFVRSNQFQFEELNDTRSVVYAKKAVVFPRRQIQFHKAEIYVDDAKILSLPLFQVNLMRQSQLVTDPILNVNDSQLEVNYPHYLSLKPGQTSLLRFRTGQSYGRTYGGTHGAFLDYELNWNRGDDMDGGLVLSGLARKDWTLGLHQYYRFDDKTSGFGQLEVPAGRSMFGGVNLSRQFEGYQASLNGNVSRTLQGPHINTEQGNFVVEKDPTKVGKLPVNLYYGFTANYNTGSTPFSQAQQSNAGLRVRAQSQPLRLNQTMTMNTSFSVSKLQGRNTPRGLSLLGEAVLSKVFSPAASLTLTYDFSEDGFNGALLGKHRFSARFLYSSGKFTTNLYGAKSIDIRQSSAYGDISYRLSNSWRLASSFTYDRYLTQGLTDYYGMLAYRLGVREFGLTWSRRTRRFGIQVLGASFN